MSVGLVIVSHSEKIADGIVDLAAQMAGGIRIVAAGGMDDGGIGTSFDKVSAAVLEADDGGGVVLLCDLGSAVLTAETVLDFLDDDLRARTRIADAPIVEGAVAAAVAAESGADLDAVVMAAASAYDAGSRDGAATSVDTMDGGPTEGSGARLGGTAILINPEGLHARPAADFVKTASGFDAVVTVNGVDAKSLLRIMSLGLAVGSEVRIEAEGPDAGAAVAALVNLIESGFGESIAPAG